MHTKKRMEKPVQKLAFGKTKSTKRTGGGHAAQGRHRPADDTICHSIPRGIQGCRCWEEFSTWFPCLHSSLLMARCLDAKGLQCYSKITLKRQTAQSWTGSEGCGFSCLAPSPSPTWRECDVYHHVVSPQPYDMVSFLTWFHSESIDYPSAESTP